MKLRNLVAPILALALVACEGAVGPMGPEGPMGAPGPGTRWVRH